MEEIGELAAALGDGAITAETLLDRCLDRIAAADARLNSFVLIDEAGARLAARQSDARRAAGAVRSPLDGIPLSIKDNILVGGLAATWGSRAFRDFVPAVDELPVARLRAAGAVIVGKTNVPELTLEGYTGNELFGTTRNPWNAALTPGGSSGGAAAGVAAGLVPAALGTDGGGSIRRPASHTGLIGWKPSTGHIPRLAGFPAILTDFEVIGTLTRSIGDARLIDDVLAGPDGRDRRSLLPPSPGRPDRRLRVCYLPRFGDTPVDPDVAEATHRFARLLADEAGAEVIAGELFFDLSTTNRIWHVVSRAGVAYLMDRHGDGFRMAAGPSVQAMAADGAKVTGADYLAALEDVAALRARFAEVFDDFDLVLTPSAAALPWSADQPYPDRIDGRPAGPRDHAVFTGWVNIGGLPAISLPAGLSRDGLPIGVQLVAGFNRDRALLDVAERLMALAPPPKLP